MLESLLRKVGLKLADHQIAYLFKVPEEFHTTPCDFFGYTVNGKAILLEAKEVIRTSLPIGANGGLLPHQWNALRDAHRASCIALICWYRKDLNQLATIDIEVALRLSEGRKSIPWKEIPVDLVIDAPSIKRWREILSPYITEQNER